MQTNDCIRADDEMKLSKVSNNTHHVLKQTDAIINY